MLKNIDLMLIIWHLNGDKNLYLLNFSQNFFRGEFKLGRKMNVKILFLDIDGVLNSKLFYKYIYKPENGWSRFDPYCVVLIKRLIEEFSMRVVITSTWRNGIVDRLMKELEENELVYHLHKDWHTPILRPASRGKEIKLWLDEHPESTDYLIIDDNENLLEDQMTRFVKTSSYAGMAQEHYNQARNILLFEKEYLILPELVREK